MRQFSAIRLLSIAALALLLAGWALAAHAQVPLRQDFAEHPATPEREPTRVLDPAGARKLLRNTGLTLQWIDWNSRGSAVISRQSTPHGDEWRLRGAQAEAGGPGRLFLDGAVREIGADYFIFQGRISIENTPDRGRHCDRTGTWRFAITHNRPYYRLRDFEWCDRLTDYIDIHI